MASQPFVGLVQGFAFNFAPKGWQKCQGQLLNINQNAALYSLVGTYYGGNGSTTFGLPNLQGRAIRGYGAGPGLSSCTMGQANGVEAVTLTVANLPQHNHTLISQAGQGPKVSTQNGADPAPSNTNNALGVLNDPSTTAVNYLYNTAVPDIALNTGVGAPSLANSGGNQPMDIMQPYIAINYCIAVTGYYPSRN